MQISPETMRLLMEMDAPADQKIALMKAMEADWLAYQPPTEINGVNEERERLRNERTYAERKRKKDRERQRRLREEARQSRESPATSRDIDGDPPATLGDSRRDTRDEPATPRARVRDNSPISETTGFAVAVIERERADDWPEGDAKTHARLLIELAASAWLDPNKSLNLNTTLGRIAAWRRDGASWEHDVVPIVTSLSTKRRTAVSSWKFFDPAIAQSIADNRAALEIPESGKVLPFRATGPPKTIDEKSSASWDYAIEKIAQDDQSQN